MFFRLAGGDYYNSGSEVKVKIPENLELIYWDYYSTDEEHYSKMMRAHKKSRITCRLRAACGRGRGLFLTTVTL